MEKSHVTLGIDLGGTKTQIGVIDPFGKVLKKELIETTRQGPDAAVKNILSVVKKLEILDRNIEKGCP